MLLTTKHGITNPGMSSLTHECCAVTCALQVTAFVGAVVGGHEPLTVLQLLWVNMIMDSMGALALATEDPTPELLLMKPYGREEPLITRNMWMHIFTQGVYQVRKDLVVLCSRSLQSVCR